MYTVNYNEQKVVLDGVVNARQLGGYPAADGKHIKNNKLIRTGALSGASEKTLNLLSEKYKIKNIVDFRMAVETNVMPDHEIKGAKYTHISVLEDFPLNEKELEIYSRFLSIKETGPRYKLICGADLDLDMRDIYKSLAFGENGKEGYKRFFEILLENGDDGGLLFHCTQGKDRTGIAAALFLSALGTDKKTIISDYLMTNTACEPMLKKICEEVKGYTDDENVLEKAMFFESVNESYITCVLETMDKEYGSPLGYILNELGVGGADLKMLRDMYTK